jgi:hypothetical protein
MRRFQLCLALGLSAAFAILLLVATLRPSPGNPAAVPAPSAGPAARPPEPPRLECVLAPGSVGKPLATFRGKAPFPDETILRATLRRHVEVDRGGILEEAPEEAGAGAAEISGGTFSFEFLTRIPGNYSLRIELRDELQDPEVRRRLPAGSFPQRWEFIFPLWGDELLPRLRSELVEVDADIDRIRSSTRLMDRESSSQARWKRSPFKDQPFTLAYQLKSAPFRFLYPGVYGDLGSSVQSLFEAARHFTWQPDDEGGAFGGSFDLERRKWILGPDERPFSFPRMEAFLVAAQEVSRREYALWILKDVKRAGLRDVVREAARSGPPEARALLQDLEAGKDLSLLEASLRGKRRSLPPEPPLEPPRGQDGAARRKKKDDAQALLQTADRLWDQPGDREAPALYRRLLLEYRDVLEDLEASVRVRNRARN